MHRHRGVTSTLLGGGQILYCNGMVGACPSFRNFFQNKSAFFWGFDVEKRRFSDVACRFGYVQFKSFFSSFLKIILSTTAKLTIFEFNQFLSCVHGAPKKIF